MRLPKIAQAFLSSLILASCVLPDQGGGFSSYKGSEPPNNPDTHETEIAQGGISGSPSSNDLAGATTVGGTADGGTTADSPSDESGGASTGSCGGANGGTGAAFVTAGAPTTAGTTSSPCDYSKLDDPSCPTTICAGVCGVSEIVPPNGVATVGPKKLFGFQLVFAPPRSVIVALGVVTAAIDPAYIVGTPGQFQLGLYQDNGGVPGAILASTGLLTANGTGGLVQGPVSSAVTLPDDPNAVYWILLVTNATNAVLVDTISVVQPQKVVFANNITCLPLATVSCGMPTVFPYNSTTATTNSPYVIPFMYARYLAQQ